MLGIFLEIFVREKLKIYFTRDFGWQQRYARVCGRIAVLSILSLLLYPFLWAWTIIGTLWFTSARNCLPEEGQKWGFLIWLLFSYCGLLCIACMCMGKWLTRRQAHLLRAQQGIPISEYGVLVDKIRVPDWAFEATGQEMRGMGQDTAAYHPGLYLIPTQREAVEALIQELPKFRLKAVPTDCSECPNCLEEFHEGNEDKFDIPLRERKWSMKSLGKKWRDYKSELKAEYFDGNDTTKVFKNPQEGTIRFQLESLVLFWNSGEGKVSHITWIGWHWRFKVI